jgi:signal transduction histidine kinase
MAFNRFVTPRPHHAATHSARDFAAIQLNTNLDAHGEEQLAERSRIAREIHDTLLQGCLAVSMQLHDAVDHVPADFPARTRLSDPLRVMERVLEEGRRAVQSLRSSREISPSFGEAFASVPNDSGFPSAAGFRVVVHGKERELRAGLRDEIYRIGREAIVNACRHSRARDIETDVEYRPTDLRIVVRDNGCGIDPQGLRWERIGHRGLAGMRERAERIGARLRVWSGVAVGTEVELCVPGRLAFEQSGSREYRKARVA